jgi:hypothetical protein
MTFINLSDKSFFITVESWIAAFTSRQFIWIEETKIARVAFCRTCCQNLISRVRIYAIFFAFFGLIRVNATRWTNALTGFFLEISFVAWFLQSK